MEPQASSSRWSFFKRSKKKKKKDKDKSDSAMGATAVSCGTSTGRATNNNLMKDEGGFYYSQNSIDGTRVPAYLQPHPTGYQPPPFPLPSHNYDVLHLPTPQRQYNDNDITMTSNLRGTRHDSLLNVSSSVTSNADSAATAGVTCLQRSKSQPSVRCSPKKSKKVPEEVQPETARNSSKKGLGAWLRRSLKRSKSKNDVNTSKEKRRELQEERDREEYLGRAAQLNNSRMSRSKLTRSVSTSMVNSSHSSSLANLVFGGAGVGSMNHNINFGGSQEGMLESPSGAMASPVPNSGQIPLTVMHTSPSRVTNGKNTGSMLPAPRPYVLPLPPKPQHLSTSPSPTQLSPGQIEPTQQQQMSSSLGMMRAQQGLNTSKPRPSSVSRRLSDQFQSSDGGNNSGAYAENRRPLPTSPVGLGSQGIMPQGYRPLPSPGGGGVTTPTHYPSQSQIVSPRGRTPSSSSQEGGNVTKRRTSSSLDRGVRGGNTPTSKGPRNRPPLPSRTKTPERPSNVQQWSLTDQNMTSSTPKANQRRNSSNEQTLEYPGGGGSERIKRRGSRSRTPDSAPNSRSASRSSDCPSSIAPTPPVPSSQTSPGGRRRTRTDSRGSSERSTAFVLIGPSQDSSRVSLESPVPSMSLASSVVSSLGVRRVSRELPPLPPKRHSLASTVISSTTASESIYNQINDDNIVGVGRERASAPGGVPRGMRAPGAPWMPPTVTLHSRTTSADILDRPTEGVADSKLGRRAQALVHESNNVPLKRAASQSFLDDVYREKFKPFSAHYSGLEHVKSACDLTMISEDKSTIDQYLEQEESIVNSPELSKSRNHRQHSHEPNASELRRKCQSYHDLAHRSDAKTGTGKNRSLSAEPTWRLSRYRSQPDMGGPGIQSRESLAFKPLSHTTSEESISSCSSDSDVEERNSRRRNRNRKRRPQQPKRRRRRPKRRSASYSNLRESKHETSGWGLDDRDGARRQNRQIDDGKNFRSGGFQPQWPHLERVESSYMLKRWWATLDDIPTAVLRGEGGLAASRGFAASSSSSSDLSDQEVSMATTASYIPGVSLADKLRLAASKGQLDKVKELIAAGANFTPDREGRTALHYAALNGYADVVSLLAAEGCDIDFQDTLGYTALHRAAAQGHLEVVRALLAEGCLVDRQDEVHGNAALHEAAWNGYSKTLELLVKQRTHVNIANKAGFSALHLAAQNGHNQSARVLLYSGTNPDRKNNYGDTALHTAARYGHAGVTRILCSAKANVNEQNKNGDTALHIAAALKRRKITKLLCESPIDVNIRNKQNESAVDVARRKEHPEIILIVTSKPKVKPKKGKFGRSKGGMGKGAEGGDGEKKEKRGFFFRRKKAKEKETLRSNPALVTAASEVSSTHYNPSQFTDTTAPAHLMAAFRDHQARQAGAAGGGAGPHLAQARGTSTLTSQDAVNGVLHQYHQKQGVKYYRDLAGNIKQGPVGYAPQCQCAPLVKRLETRVDADRANLYDHIDASHRTLGDRVDQLDRRTAQQVYSIDKLTKERLEAERKERQEQIENRALAERLETERQLEVQGDCIRTELKAWVDARLTGFEKQYSSHDDGCDYILNSNFNFGRDGLHQTNLFRSRSDETLSVSSSHPGKKQSKGKARAAHELKKMTQQNGGHSRPPRTRGIRSSSHSRLRVHDRPTTSMAHDGKPSRTLYPEERKGRPLGHSPEGQSTKNDSFTEQPVGDRPLPEWIRPSPAVSTPRHFDEAEGNSYSGNTMPVLGAHLNALHLSPVSPDDPTSFVESTPGPHTPHGALYPTPESTPAQRPFTIMAQVHHAKTDSGSNPDSGYGGKGYGGGSGTNRLRSGSDQHDTSLATNASSTTTEGTSCASDASEPLHVTRHFFDTVSAQMEKWYERRLKEVEKKAEDRVKQESSAMQSRIRALEERFSEDKSDVRLGPQIEASIGTQV